MTRTSRIMQRSEPPPQRLVIGIAIMAMSILLGLAMGEFAASFVIGEQPWPELPEVAEIDPARDNPFVVHRRPFFYFHLPNSHYVMRRPTFVVDYQINARGFRGPDVPEKGNEKRLLVIGASVVEGYGMELGETFAMLLDGALDPDGWGAMNVGVMGSSPIYYAANVPRYLALQPDAVVVILDEGDAIGDRLLESRYFNHPRLVNEAALIEGGPREAQLPLNSRIATLITDLTRKDSTLEALIRRNLFERQARPDRTGVGARAYVNVAASEFDREFNVTLSYLDSFVEQLEREHVPVIIVNLGLNALTKEPIEIESTHTRLQDEALKKWTVERQLPYRSIISTFSDLAAEWTQDEMLTAGDEHPSAAVHAEIAEALEPYIRRQLTSGRGPGMRESEEAPAGLEARSQ